MRHRPRTPAIDTLRRGSSRSAQSLTPTLHAAGAPAEPKQSGNSTQSGDSSAAMAVVPVSCILLACGINNWALELIVSKKRNPFGDPGAGTLLTLMQFMFVAALTLPEAVFNLKFFTGGGGPLFRPLVIPFKFYLLQTVFFAPMSFLNNKAFDFNITQPVHMVFRSSSLVVTCAMGYLFFSRRYSVFEMMCVAMVTTGVVLATGAEALLGEIAASGCCEGDSAPEIDTVFAEEKEPFLVYYGTWLIGVSMLVAVMVLGTLLGQVQNHCRETFGTAPVESMFYAHLLPLPMYIMALSDLSSHAALWNASPPASKAWAFMFSGATEVSVEAMAAFQGEWSWMGPLGAVPIMWHYVVVNMLSQYLCIRAVYTLISRFTQLTVTMSLTVRKVFSLLLSLWFFGNPFTAWHWVGAVMVFAGATAYSQRPKPRAPPKKHE